MTEFSFGGALTL